MNLLRSFHRIVIGLRSGLWLGQSKTWTLFFFKTTLCRMTCACILAFSFIMCRYIHCSSMMAGCPRPRAATTAQAMILPSTVFHRWRRFLRWNAVCPFLQHNSFSFKPIRSVLVSSIPLHLPPIALWLVHVIFSKQLYFWRQWLSAVHSDLLMLGSLTLSLANMRKAFRCLVRSYSGNFFKPQTILHVSALEWSCWVEHFSGR